MKQQLKLKQLAWALGISIALTALITPVITWLAVDDELSELLYEDIQQQTQLLYRLIDRGHIAADELEVFLNESFIDDHEDTFLISVEHLKEHWYASNFNLERHYGSTESGVIQMQHMNHFWKGYQLRQGDLLIKLMRRDDMANDIKGDVTEDVLLPIMLGNLISIFLLLVLLNLVTAPLNRLVHLIRQRHAEDLSELPQISRLTELQAITSSLNRLITGIKETLQREKRFTSDVAHELRTPLTTLKLELSMPDTDHKSVRKEVDRLIHVVDQLLILARIEAGQWQQHCSRFNIRTALQDVCQRSESRLQQAGIRFDYALSDFDIEGDPTLISLLVENLLNNAARHAETADHVSLKMQVTASRLRLIIEDNGRGIPAPKRQAMLEPFARLDQRTEGLGLGLAISQQIARLHGSQLALEDAEPGLRVCLTFDHLMQS
ncbi:ATP-binding protein [Oceanospirillum linum]|uniref:histidine kinase n=1 Tax=Oceanospirillum linum TaxID=966 RepID=A0A1T1HB12_OCELI|nr:ATP-binding protein [Oceanospirillum linum]OOV87003.1 hypothetical protein BTA35_0208285 [Oceanospirillum linum]SEF71224.1 two-component system, OmpR family, sensor histidine kinase QseC [Oleiphilus messinensis]SMP15501.1 two-component system, OmpR family, sensor histidine kinase BasS/two-component system, OmpR family, sensor histidine kinase QseC [Oceanospirillum linum]